MYSLLAIAAVFKTVLSVIVALLILLATITIHEFGHYIVGKIFKFKINEFAIGMGPAIYKKTKKNGEVFSIRIFPLGGFCAFEGEDEDDETVKKANEKAKQKNGKDGNSEKTDVYENTYGDSTVNEPDFQPEKAQKTLSKDAFNNKKPWQRILVLLAGATFNFFVAVLIVMIYFTAYGHFGFSAAEVRTDLSTAETTQVLQKGDVLLEIDGKFLYFTTDLVDALKGKKTGDVVEVKVERDGKKQTLNVTLVSDVNIDNMADVYPAFESLGIATVLHIKTTDGTDSPLKDYKYVFRFYDHEEFADCTRIYDLDDLYQRLKDLKPYEEIELIVPDGDGDEVNDIIALRAPNGFDGVNKNDRTAVLAAFDIVDEQVLSYQVGTTPIRFKFFEGLGRAVVYSFKTVGITLQSFGQLITGKLALTSVSGPVGTITLTTQYVALGFDYLLNIAAMIGLSVAIFNLLPIPALDGARAVFVLIEWIRKKPINRNVEGMIHFIGLIALFAFAILVDLLKLF